MYKRFLIVLISLLFVVLSVVRQAVDQDDSLDPRLTRDCPDYFLVDTDGEGRPTPFRNVSTRCFQK